MLTKYNIDKKTGIIAAAVSVGVLAIGGGGSFYFSPYLALNQMKTAIVNRDAAALSKQINFPELRTSIKAGVRSQVLRLVTLAGTEATPEMLEKINREVDKKITPEGLDELMQDKIPGARLDVSELEKNIADSEIQMKYESLDKFVIIVTDKKDRAKTVNLTLNRTGFDWKLAGVNISKV